MNRNKKIVLVSPPAIALKDQIRKTIPPFGLLTIAATVEERGYDDLLCIDSVLDGFENIVCHCEEQLLMDSMILYFDSGRQQASPQLQLI